MESTMNIKKLSLLSLLLLAFTAQSDASNKDKKPAKTIVQTTNNRTKKFSFKKWFEIKAIPFALGALYTGSRVFFDRSEPTLTGFAKSFGKRAIFEAIGIPWLLINLEAGKSEDRPLTLSSTWKTIFAHAAYSEMSSHKIVGPAFSIINGFFFSIINILSEDDAIKNAKYWKPRFKAFNNGLFFGSLLGVGLRYRHDLGSGLKYTSHSAKQLIPLFYNAKKYLSLKIKSIVHQ